MTITATLLLLGLAAWPSDRVDPETAFEKAWNTPAPPLRQRVVVDGWRAPAFNELHDMIKRRPKRKADHDLESKLKHVFYEQGVFTAPHSYERISCRAGLCEYVIVYDRKSTPAQRGRSANGLNASSRIMCPINRCLDAILVGGGANINDDKAVLGYFVPKMKMFLGDRLR